MLPRAPLRLLAAEHVPAALGRLAASAAAGPVVVGRPATAAFLGRPSWRTWGVIVIRGQRTEAPATATISASAEDMNDEDEDFEDDAEASQSSAQPCCSHKLASAPPPPPPRVRSPRRAMPAAGASLAERFPRLAAEWDEELNTKRPSEVTPGSHYRAAWRCSTDPSHRWSTLVKSRAGKDDTGCPQCWRTRPRLPRAGFPGGRAPFEQRMLAAVAPLVALEWHPALNGEVTPRDVTYGSASRKYWWRCLNDPTHEWEASVWKRVVHGRSCPYCSRSAWGVTPRNSLAGLAPGVAAEWAHELNGGLSPEQVRAGSNVRAWWRCGECGHVWLAQIGSRAVNGCGCPSCKNRAVTGRNNLEALHPELAKEWDTHANAGLLPSHVLARSRTKRWWTCSECGCKWAAEPLMRTRPDRPTGCPACARRAFLTYFRHNRPPAGAGGGGAGASSPGPLAEAA
eukprot:tig00001224_g7628.t1